MAEIYTAGWEVPEGVVGISGEGPMTLPNTSFYEGMPIVYRPKLKSLLHCCSDEDAITLAG